MMYCHSFRFGIPRGFTIIELLVVMAILGILAAAILPLSEALVTAQKERDLRQSLLEIRQALDEYKRLSDRGLIPQGGGSSGYPPNLKVLSEGTVSSSGQSGRQQTYILRRLPRDPFADPKLPAEDTWRLRSYTSPPDRPMPGDDVFDIRSSSDATALDGTPYARW